MSEDSNPIPKEIGRASENDIRISWMDGHESIYLARDLRLRCQCAACVEEMTGEPMLDPDSVPKDVHPLEIQLVGRYAIHIRWSDGHSTGIYPFTRLRGMCNCTACRMQF